MKIALALCAALAATPELSIQGKPFERLAPAAPGRPLAASLFEISGLEPADDGLVYAHTDESATIYELSVATGGIARRFSFGRPTEIGDFEAITRRGDILSLVTSRGLIYEAQLSPERSSLAFRAYDTGLGAACEVEGFAAVGDDFYYLACKRMGGRLVVHQWSRAKGASTLFDTSLDGVVPNPKAFRAADLVIDKKSGTLLILDSGAGAILEVTLKGAPAGYWRLGGKHRHTEGLALLADGTLVVANEGKRGKKGASAPALLTLYPKRR